MRGEWLVGRLRQLERVTRLVDQDAAEALERRWSTLPPHVQTAAQTLGRIAVGCEGTHGVFPRCNFTCTPCYHARSANRVRTDGPHTVGEVERQVSLLEEVRGPHAHMQLIGGEVSLLPPEAHAEALLAMRRHGREPMSFTHGDFEYDYLERLALDRSGRRRFRRISFAAHFDTTMRGRRGLRRPAHEQELNEHRRRFCEMFRRLRAEHDVRSFLAHNMTVTPNNLEEIPQLIRDCRAMGFNMFSFQPAAFVGDRRRWTEDYRSLDPEAIWVRIEEGAGARLPYRVAQTGDERCNRTAFGVYVSGRWIPYLDDHEPGDFEARDALFGSLGGAHWNAPPALLGIRLFRAAISEPRLVGHAARWFARLVRRAGGVRAVIRALARHEVTPMTFVMHRFMHADDVRPAWELLEAGRVSDEPAVRETQERLQACFYAMAHPESGRLVPACVQHALLDPAENEELTVRLALPRVRAGRNGWSLAQDGPGSLSSAPASPGPVS